MTDTFANHPQSISEVRAHKANDAALATPRDALISVLRDLDAGKIAADAMVICWRGPVKDGAVDTGWEGASPDVITTIGLLYRAANLICLNADK